MWQLGMAGVGVLCLVSACPARKAKRAEATSVNSILEGGAAPAMVLADAGPKADARAALGRAGSVSLCGSGADCTAQGKEAFDRRHYVDAHSLFERACALDDADGCRWFGLDLQTGIENLVAPDEQRSLVVMDKACGLGAFEACWILGNRYLYGTRSGVVARDPARAVKLYEKACVGGEAGSCSSLAQCYADGLGVSKDKALAQKYRKMAEELGFVGP